MTVFCSNYIGRISFVFIDVNEESEISSYTKAKIAYMEIDGVTCSADEALNYILWMANVFVESGGNVHDNEIIKSRESSTNKPIL